MTTEERRRRRFTVEFRKEQVLLIETGQRTVVEVSRLYEIRPANVRYWMRKYGSKPLPEKIIVSNGKELDRLKDLENQIKTLREVIANQQVELYYQKSVIGLAKERLGEDFEKNDVPITPYDLSIQRSSWHRNGKILQLRRHIKTSLSQSPKGF